MRRLLNLPCSDPNAPNVSVEVVESDEIPDSVITLAKQKRQELLEQLAEVDDEIGEMMIMDEEPSVAQVTEAVRRATVGLKFTPVFLGSAIKNTGVQPLLDGVCNYLPTPSESEITAHDTSLPVSAPQVPLTPAGAAPLVALAFKLEEGRFGQLTYMRVYQGSMRKGQFIFHARTGKKVKIPRLVRMHSNEMEEVNDIGPGEICAIFGVDCASGDTFTDGTTSYSMACIFCQLNAKPSTDDLSLLDFYVRSRPSHFTRTEARWKREPQLFSCVEPIPKGRPHIPSTHRSREQRSKLHFMHLLSI